MIAIRRTPPAAMLERHARVAAAMAETERERPALANIGPAREMWTPRPLYFRGRRIPPRPVPWEDGLELLELGAQIESAAKVLGTAAGVARYHALLERAVALCWELCRPRWVPRWLQRCRPNPFRRASLEEVREILGFFARCQTISLVGHRSERAAPRRRMSST